MKEGQPTGQQKEKGFLGTWWEKIKGFLKENPLVAALVGIGLVGVAGAGA